MPARINIARFILLSSRQVPFAIFPLSFEFLLCTRSIYLGIFSVLSTSRKHMYIYILIIFWLNHCKTCFIGFLKILHNESRKAILQIFSFLFRETKNIILKLSHYRKEWQMRHFLQDKKSEKRHANTDNRSLLARSIIDFAVRPVLKREDSRAEPNVNVKNQPLTRHDRSQRSRNALSSA